jgi:hypothetical protein
MRFPDFATINVAYATILSFNIYRKSDNSLLGTLIRNTDYLYDISYAPGKQALVSATPSLSADIFLAQDCLNSSDSGDSY